MKLLADRGVVQGLLADGQCFTVGQLQRCLKKQDPDFDLDAVISSPMRIVSAERKARKPSDTLFRAAVTAAGARGLSPSEVLHVGSNLARDIGPAKKHGFRTALFAGDRASLVATPEQLKDAALRPDALVTELPQVLELIS
jgi:FMN phosphatase YigB (HAD superfamily)